MKFYFKADGKYLDTLPQKVTIEPRPHANNIKNALMTQLFEEKIP